MQISTLEQQFDNITVPFIPPLNARSYRKILSYTAEICRGMLGDTYPWSLYWGPEIADVDSPVCRGIQ